MRNRDPEKIPNKRHEEGEINTGIWKMRRGGGLETVKELENGDARGGR